VVVARAGLWVSIKLSSPTICCTTLGPKSWSSRFWADIRHSSTCATAVLRRFRNDHSARDAISDTLKFAQICPEDFDGGICIGALEEQAGGDDPAGAQNLITALLVAGKPVAVVPSDLLPSSQRPMDGILIIGDQARSPARAARALLASLELGREPGPAPIPSDKSAV